MKVSKARLKGVYDDLWAEDAMVTLARFSRQGARQWTDGRGGTQRSEASAGRGGRGREGGGGAMAVDVVVAADMMVYLSELGPLFRAAAGALRTGGIFAFTTESLILPAKPANGDAGTGAGAGGGTGTTTMLDFHFNSTVLRTTHSDSYVAAVGEEMGFRLARQERRAGRKEGSADVLFTHTVLVLVRRGRTGEMGAEGVDGGEREDGDAVEEDGDEDGDESGDDMGDEAEQMMQFAQEGAAHWGSDDDE